MSHLHDHLREAVRCPLPDTLEVIGDRWSMLILRGAFNGIRHFDTFQSELGIARNILSNRLHKLVEHGIFSRDPCEHDRRKVEYRLTERGVALLPALIALRQWGEKYACNEPSNLVLVDSRDRKPIAAVRLYGHDGRPLEYEDLDWEEAAVVGMKGAAREECC